MAHYSALQATAPGAPAATDSQELADGPPAFPGLAPGGPVSAWEAAGYFAVAALGVSVIGLRSFPSVLSGGLVNPDSYMRLLRLREIVAQHAAVDVVPRDASGAGALLHWSHLLDGLMILLAAPLRLVMNDQQAVHAVAVAAGPIGFGLLIVALAWAVAPLTQRRWRWLLPLLGILSPVLAGISLPGVVRHNVFVAIVTVMVSGWALRVPSAGVKAGCAIGAWAAAGIWLDPETMPFILAAFAGIGVFWLCHPENVATGRALAAGGAAFAALVLLALAIDPPAGGYAQAEIDRLSVVYAVLGLVIWAVSSLLHWLDGAGLPAAWRGVAGAAAALAGFGVWVALFPSVTAGPNGLIDPQHAAAYFGINPEMQPLTGAAQIAGYLMDGVLATAAALWLAARTRSPIWAYAGVCAALSVALGASYLRFAMYPELVGVAMLPIILSAIDRAREVADGGWLAGVRWFVAFVYLLFPETNGLGNLLPPADTKAVPAATAVTPRAATCDVEAFDRLLRRHFGEIVLAEPSDAPALLYRTEVLTAGSLYHRNMDAFLRMRAAWRGREPGGVPAAFRQTRASLVLICPREARSALVADLPPDTLWDLLAVQRPPPWLTLVAEDAASGFRLYGLTARRE